jgi:hypothetical protein
VRVSEEFVSYQSPQIGDNLIGKPDGRRWTVLSFPWKAHMG